MVVCLTLDAGIFDERSDFLSFPNGSAGAELYGLGETACATAFPPGAFADGDDGKNLGQAEKTVNRDRGCLLL